MSSATMNRIRKIARHFASEERGVQVIEYGLIIAVVALTLLIGLREMAGPNFSGFIVRITNCLSSAASCR